MGKAAPRGDGVCAHWVKRDGSADHTRRIRWVVRNTACAVPHAVVFFLYSCTGMCISALNGSVYFFVCGVLAYASVFMRTFFAFIPFLLSLCIFKYVFPHADWIYNGTVHVISHAICRAPSARHCTGGGNCPC